MGKMCIVDGDYSDGPLVLPPCEAGTRVRLEFGFSTRVPQEEEEDYGGPIKLDSAAKKKKKKKAEFKVPPRRFRIGVTIEAAPESKRNWRTVDVEIISESRVSGGGDSGDETAPTATATPPEPEKGVKLGEDDIATGNWRAVGGVTFLSCESLLDDTDFELLFEDKKKKEEGGGAKPAVAAAGKSKKVGRGRVKRGAKGAAAEAEAEAGACIHTTTLKPALTPLFYCPQPIKSTYFPRSCIKLSENVCGV